MFKANLRYLALSQTIKKKKEKKNPYQHWRDVGNTVLKGKFIAVDIYINKYLPNNKRLERWFSKYLLSKHDISLQLPRFNNICLFSPGTSVCALPMWLSGSQKRMSDPLDLGSRGLRATMWVLGSTRIAGTPSVDPSLQSQTAPFLRCRVPRKSLCNYNGRDCPTPHTKQSST